MALEKLLPWANLAYIVLVALGAYGIFQLTARANAEKDRELAKYQADSKVQIEAAQAEASKADARAAEANAAAEQAKLELAEFKEPRRLSPSDQNRLVSALNQFSGQPFAFSAYEDPEAHALVEQLDWVLKQAGWQRASSQVGVIVHDVAGDTVGGSVATGVSTYVGKDNPEAEKAMVMLSGLLTRAGIPCQPSRTEQLNGKTPKAIVINVGKKPVGTRTADEPPA